MTGDTFHKLEEFVSFPWEQLDDDWFLSCGGIGIDCNYRNTLSFVRPDGTADIWEIPPQLKRLLEAYRERGDDNARRAIRQAIGL